ncbi:MAG: HD domain-containing protein [Desulfobacterales bacterium]|nr:HD domain-containing protein [Desulfobacterales bacterium]
MEPKNQMETIRSLQEKLERQRQREVKLKQSEAGLRAMLEYVEDQVTLLDDQLNILWASSSSKRRFGGDMVGRKCYKVYHDSSEQCPIEDCMVQQTLEDGCRHELDVRVSTKERDTVYLHCTSHPALKDDNGRITAVVKIAQDITKQRQTGEELKDSMEKLRKLLGGTVQAMAMTVEARDAYTAGHQKRTTNIARCIAQEMGLSEEQIDGIRMAGVVHDLGKISIPAEILSKPGKINEVEFSLIKNHPLAGFEILKEIEFQRPVAQIVLQHHERMDGSGYPYGLKGEDILLEARIIAVADVIEAMASHRPYRAAIGLKEAMIEITNNQGTYYDFEVVAATKRVFESGNMPLQ